MKTNQDHKRIASAFERLFRTYPQFGQGNSPEEITRDRVEKAKVYFDAVAFYSEDDVEAAVEAILTGTAAGMNPNYAPPAPAFAGECRRQMNMRLRRAELERLGHPRLPPPDIEKTDEQRARARALMQQTVDNLSAGTALESAEALAASKARWEKVNARFQPEMTDEAIAERLLGRRPFDVGAPESDEAAA
jgi:hypothetical protein